jgi:shikimate kinase
MKTPPRIALIGFMGSGKSTVGAILAKKLGYRFVDLDSEVEKKAGKKIADIFREQGEPAFRAMESECLRGLSGRTGVVIAAGGGAPVQDANHDFFKNASTIFLQTSLETALARAVMDGSRPLLAQDPAEVRRLYESRAEIYQGLGRSVSTEGKTPIEIAETIMGALEATT